jgi:hypothetical protein
MGGRKVIEGQKAEGGSDRLLTVAAPGAMRESPQKTAGPRRAPRVRLPKFVSAYFFFDAFLLLFFADLAAAFLVAIALTTFHAVRDLPVAPTWQKAPDFSGQLESEGVGDVMGKRCR